MNERIKSFCFLVPCAAAAAALLLCSAENVRPSRAAGIPSGPAAPSFWYSGTVYSNGMASTASALNIGVRVFNTENPVAGTTAPACEYLYALTPLSAGQFRVKLPACESVVRQFPVLYVQLNVESDITQNPLPQLGAVPYASQAENGIPPGTIIDYAGSGTPPGGYLPCDGVVTYDGTLPLYADLYNAIKATWGGSEATSTFKTPDLRGRTTIGAGSGAGLTSRVLGQQMIGSETHPHTIAAHDHASGDLTAQIGVNLEGNVGSLTRASSFTSDTHRANGTYLNSSGNYARGAVVVGTTSTTALTTAPGSGMQPSAVVRKWIKL